MFVGNDYLRNRKLAAEPVASLDVNEGTCPLAPSCGFESLPRSH